MIMEGDGTLDERNPNKWVRVIRRSQKGFRLILLSI